MANFSAISICCFKISVKGMSFVNTKAEINGGMGTDSITVTKTTVNGGELDIEGEGVND